MGKPRTFALVALLACLPLATGCFGYNRSAKRWAYAGDTVLILGGGGLIASDVLASEPPCEGMGCPSFESPITGMLVAGVVLATAGLIGILLNATRPEVKTSR